MIEDLYLSDGDKSVDFSDCSDPGLVSALIEMENYDNRIGWYLDTDEAVKVRDWLSAVIERATGKAGEQAELEARVETAEKQLAEWAESRGVLIGRYEAQRDITREARAALTRAEEIAKETSVMIEDDIHELAGCRFTGAGGDDDVGVSCWACLVQDKLAEIRVEKLTKEGSNGCS